MGNGILLGLDRQCACVCTPHPCQMYVQNKHLEVTKPVSLRDSSLDRDLGCHVIKMIKKSYLHFHGLLMWTNDAQINYKMSPCYGVNLLILAEAIMISIYTQNGFMEIPRELHPNFIRKFERPKRKVLCRLVWSFLENLQTNLSYQYALSPNKSLSLNPRFCAISNCKLCC